MKQTVGYRDSIISFDLSSSGRTYQAVFGEKTVSVELLRVDGEWLDLLVDGIPMRAYVTRDGAKSWVTVNGQTLELVNSPEKRQRSGHGGQHTGELTAKMPGLVRAVLVAEGDRVVKGQALAAIEAMKMENKVVSPINGLIQKLMITIGQTVEREQALMIIIPAVETPAGSTTGSD